ncbi:hypothetical protein BWI96_08565 [Siphonobacter sp. SORGH_AS_0500]|uniref:efflux RND transporter periplasmic adaptor subunit n=1 Tax=Siphonobacter sp. SORGH_AS_0500 TaxID=1864824 RepID=UPI000CBD69C8|nr:efflux RND transporter periplasmic adaptor subunit [Siphonobacter sp. SORGH_AS_0500]PKK36935.1 hypothetical protein BWI96_08565 [Siphonobacter sp. SORGH_AS_0500]
MKKHFLTYLLLSGLMMAFPACKEKADSHEGHDHSGHSHEEASQEGHTHGEHDHHHEEGHSEHEEEEAELTESQYKAINVMLGSVESRSLSGVIQATGSLVMPPQQQISLSFPYGGIVRSTTLLPGKWVNKGETVVTLENPEFITLQQEYLEAASQLTYLEQENRRQDELSRENVAAAKVFQRTNSELKTLNARLEGLKQRLSLLNINTNALGKGIRRTVAVVAPASGYVTHVNVNMGKAIQANEMLAELADTRFVQAELNIFEKDLSRLKIGQQVHVRLGNESTDRLATIYLIGREISPERMVKVLCKLSQTNRDLVPGTYLTAHLETGGTQVKTLPDAAVVRSGDKQYIFVSEGKHNEEGSVHYPFKRVEIRTGISQNGYVEVFPPADVKANTIVVKGAYDLLSVMNNSEHGHSH